MSYKDAHQIEISPTCTLYRYQGIGLIQGRAQARCSELVVWVVVDRKMQ